jgi:hypothetical protein
MGNFSAGSPGCCKASETLSHELMVHCLHTHVLEGNLDAPRYNQIDHANTA